MQGVYTFQYQATSVNAARTLMYITAPATQPIEILSAKVTETNVVSNEQIECMISRITTLGAPTATTVTATLTEASTASFTGTCKANVTSSEPTYGPVQLDQNAYPNVAGYVYDPLPEERPVIAPGVSVGLKFLNISSNTYNFDITMTVRTIG